MSKEKLKLTCYGGVGSVTGANFILEGGGAMIAVDCGLEQGSKSSYEENSKPFPYDPSRVDYLFATHAHIDHIGRIPKLVKDGFRGKIFSTPETREIASLMFSDALKIFSYESQKKEGKEPLYESRDVKKALSLWETLPYHQEKSLEGGFRVYLKNAGHILGSSMIEFTYDGRKVVFTGDLGNSPAPLMPDTEEVKDANYLVMDSVYGDRNHESKTERKQKLERVVKEAINRGGALLMPAFSLARTQVILHELNDLVESGSIPSVPVFLDSPLAIKITEIYKNSYNLYNSRVGKEALTDDDIFNFPKLKFTFKVRDSQEILSTPNPKIIIAGSGMSTGGRILGHESHFLPDPKSTILLIGYQSLGTVGRQIQEGVKSVKIDDTDVPVRAKVESIGGYSSHKGSDDLLEFVSDSTDTLKKVFVTMGEPKSSIFLVQRIRDYLGVDAVYPEKGKTYFLE